MPSWVLLAIGSALAAALVAVLAKVGISKVDTTLATTLRALVMAGFFVVVALALGKVKLLGTVDRTAATFIILSGLAGAVSWLLYFYALRSGPASAVAALDRASVVFVFVLAILFLGEKFELRTAAGAVLVVAGAVLMSLK